MKPHGLPQCAAALALALFVAAVTGCSKVDSDDKPASANTNAENQAGVTLDAATQARIGLKTDAPAPAQWQPQIHAVGTVEDPLVFMAAVSDLASAQAAADLSGNELARTQKLADENNASARALETAQADATHDQLALKSAEAAFSGNWGPQLATRSNLVEFAQQLATNDHALVKLSLPAGTILNPVPATARVSLLQDETNLVSAEFVDDLGIDPATQTQTLLFSTNEKLPRGAAVTASLDLPGDPVSGLVVPFSAVLRHQGLGWIYVQTGTNQFLRTEIPLDRLMDNGWFVSENLSATNQIVITGAQTILSTELGASAGDDGD